MVNAIEEQYFFIDLYRKPSRIYLVEDKELQNFEYTKPVTSGGKKRYLELFPITREIGVGGIYRDATVCYSTYEFFNQEMLLINDLGRDGFSYDGKKVFYGSTKLYVTLRDGHYYDILTNCEIPDISAHRIVEIKNLAALQEMRKDLSIVQGHLDLYSFILKDYLDKLSTGYHNYLNAYQEYTEKLNALQKEAEERSQLERLQKERLQLQQEKSERILELQKIREVVHNVKKGS